MFDHDAGPDESVEGDASRLGCNRGSAGESRSARRGSSGRSFKHIFPEEDVISDWRFNRAGKGRKEKGKSITVFLLDEVEELRG